MIDSPIVFGMHNNAEIAFQLNESKEMIGTMLQLQPREAGGAEGKSSDDIVLEAAADIKAQIPPLLDKTNSGPNTFRILDTGLVSSLDTVLAQEMEKFNRLLNTMQSSLVELEKAIKGLTVMSLELDKMYTSFLLNQVLQILAKIVLIFKHMFQVPGLWTVVGFASRKSLLSWVKDLLFRIEFLATWIVKGRPAAFPLQAFFFPQGFMTGILQTHARKYEVAVDELTFNFAIFNGEADGIQEEPDDGVIVYGMYLEGARFNREKNALDDALPGTAHCCFHISAH